MSRKPPIELPETDDPYVLLDVRPGASAEQIRRAYLRRVKVYKPDRYPAEFRRVREAYDRLREQEKWFDAWRQASEVVRKAAEAAARADDDEGEGGAAEGDETGDGTQAREADADDASEHEDRDRDDDDEDEDDGYADDADDGYADDADGDDDDVEALIAALEDELRQDREGGNGRDDSAWSFELDEAAAERRRRSARTSEVVEEVAKLRQRVHAALEAGRCVEAANELLTPEAEVLASHPELSTLLLEVCCAVVWDEPAQFEALVARYGDLVSAQDTEYRDGALLHRRILANELPAWRQAVAAWPELHQFVVLGASLRAPAEAELGLRLGRRAAADPSGFLHVLTAASAVAPGIVALYVGMAERWARYYGRLSLHGPAPVRPSVEQAADDLARAVLAHRWVRWEQVRPLLVSAILVAVLIFARSPLVELLVIGTVIVLWGWRAWAASPEARIYDRVVRPTAAAWLWATHAAPEALAAALRTRLPKPATWAAVLHPGTMAEYPDRLADDLALAAFGVTVPMVPLLRASPGQGPH